MSVKQTVLIALSLSLALPFISSAKELRSIRLVANQAEPTVKATSEKVIAVGLGEVTLTKKGSSTSVSVPAVMEQAADRILAGGISEKFQHEGVVEYKLSPSVVVEERSLPSNPVVAPVAEALPSEPVAPKAEPAGLRNKTKPVHSPPLGAVMPQSQKKKINGPLPPGAKKYVN